MDPKERFAKRADFYAKFRPGYPFGILDILRKNDALGPGDTVADVGSGTGLLTRLFLENGNRVFAIEPSKNMRSHAEGSLSRFRNFISVNGTAEATALTAGCVDLITVGQALHWFNPEKTKREFSRISRPGTALCVAYNDRDHKDAFMRAYQRLVLKHQTDMAAVPTLDDKRVSAFFEDGTFSRYRLANWQFLDFQGLEGRLLSASYMPLPDDGIRFERFELGVRKLFNRHSSDGRVKLSYVTNIFIGKVDRRK